MQADRTRDNREERRDGASTLMNSLLVNTLRLRIQYLVLVKANKHWTPSHEIVTLKQNVNMMLKEPANVKGSMCKLWLQSTGELVDMLTDPKC